MAKITGKEGLRFTGKARAFDREEDFVHAVESGSIKKGEKTVVILRYLGPKGGPGASPHSRVPSRRPSQSPHTPSELHSYCRRVGSGVLTRT